MAEKKVGKRIVREIDFSTLRKTRIPIRKIQEEHRRLVETVSRKERKAVTRGVRLPSLYELNQESGDALQVGDPLLLVRHWGNYCAVAKTLKLIFEKEELKKLRALEIGGGAVFPYWLAQELGCQYLASDYQEKISEYGRTVLAEGEDKFQFLQVDATQMEASLADRPPFDLIVINECLEHLTNQQLEAFSKGAESFLKRGGIVIGTTPNRAMYPDETPSNYPPHVYERSEYTREELAKALKRFAPGLATKEILGIFNEQVTRRIRKNFGWERLGNSVNQALLTRFPGLQSRLEKLVYKGIKGIRLLRRGKGGRARVEFPEWAQKVWVKGFDEGSGEEAAFGLLFILQART